jgi:hypothetical protein
VVATDPSNADWLHDVSVTNERLGYVLKLRRDLANAVVAYHDGLIIAKALVAKDPENGDLLHDVSVFNDGLGDVLLEQGDLKGALATYRDGLLFGAN